MSGVRDGGGLAAKGQHRGIFCGDIVRREFSLLIVVAVTQIYTCVNIHKRKFPFYSMIIKKIQFIIKIIVDTLIDYFSTFPSSGIP